MGFFTNFKRPKLNFLIYYDGRSRWQAYCLEFNLKGSSSKSTEKAVDDLVGYIKSYIETLIRDCEKNIDCRIDPAPDEYWKKRFYAKKFGYRTLRELKHIRKLNEKEIIDKYLPFYRIVNYLPLEKAELCYL